MITAVVASIVLLLFLLWLFNHLHQKSKDDHQLDELLEQKSDELRLSKLSLEKLERRHLEQRAKVSLVNSITPFIDRIMYSIGRLEHLANSQLGGTADSQMMQSTNVEIEYIRELTDKIIEQNDLLTQWIQLRQGELSLHIESFKLQPLFDMLSRGKAGFDLKNIALRVEPTDCIVKADRVLTLPMYADLALEDVDRICDIVLSCRG